MLQNKQSDVNQQSVAKYAKRCKINLALQNKYEIKFGVAKEMKRYKIY